MKPTKLLLISAILVLPRCAFLKEQFGPTERVDHSPMLELKMTTARDAYKECMEQSAIQFNTSNATAYEVADAAVANCEGEHRAYVTATFDHVWYEEGAYIPRYQVREMVEEVGQEFRQKTRAQVVLIVVGSRVPAKTKKKD